MNQLVKDEPKVHSLGDPVGLAEQIKILRDLRHPELLRGKKRRQLEQELGVDPDDDQPHDPRTTRGNIFRILRDACVHSLDRIEAMERRHESILKSVERASEAIERARQIGERPPIDTGKIYQHEREISELQKRLGSAMVRMSALQLRIVGLEQKEKERAKRTRSGPQEPGDHGDRDRGGDAGE